MPDNPAPRRRWFGFGLLMALMVVIAALVAYLSWVFLSPPNPERNSIEAAAIAVVSERCNVKPEFMRAKAKRRGNEWSVRVYPQMFSFGPVKTLTFSSEGELVGYKDRDEPATH